MLVELLLSELEQHPREVLFVRAAVADVQAAAAAAFIDVLAELQTPVED